MWWQIFDLVEMERKEDPIQVKLFYERFDFCFAGEDEARRKSVWTRSVRLG